MLALGVMLISRTPSYSGSLTAILFGDALGVTGSDLVVLGIVFAVSAVTSVILYRPLLVLAFNEQKARLLGLRPALAHWVLLMLITAVIVGAFQTVGTLLVFGLLVGPPATSALLVRRVPVMMVVAALIGVLAVVLGLVLSYYLDTAGSATMALIPIVLFFVVLAGRSLADRRRRYGVSERE
jgi:ABC-type Mn2+/Zn2+ transport system permease subunit